MSASSWLRAVAIVIASLAVVPACRSGKKSEPATGSGSSAQPIAPTDPGPPVAQPAAGSNGVDVWDEVPPAPVKRSGPPPTRPADPGAVIARFDTECPAGTTTPTCQDLRQQVERILLDTLVALRAVGKDIDRELYRVAARAELPQLACIGLRELPVPTNRSADDDASLLEALDSPWPFVRNAALDAGRSVPAIAQLYPRAQLDRNRGVNNCIGSLRDQAPGLKWAGGYPTAQFRYFASGPSLRWFTTTDPVDKVIASFNKSGRPALTASELQAAQMAKYVDEVNRITAVEPAAGQEDKTAERIMQLMQRASNDWSSSFTRIAGAGEIRYVMIAPDQAIAIFKDEVLHATSIVAPRPPERAPMATDASKLEREKLMRTVFAN